MLLNKCTPVLYNVLNRRTQFYTTKIAQRLAGKTIFITGASSGIGLATAKQLAEISRGNIKLILASLEQDKLNEIKADMIKKYPKLEVLASGLDVSKYHDIPKWIDDLPPNFKDIDVLVNNAGLVHGTDRIGDISQTDIDIMFNTNVMGLISLTQAVLPIMKKKNKGDIVNLSSIAARDAYPGGGIYCATKSAVSSFTTVLRRELIDTKIRVLEIQPGPTRTAFSLVRFNGDQQKADDVYKGTEPLMPEDIADVIVFGLTRRENTVIAETMVFPQNQGSSFHIHREKV